MTHLPSRTSVLRAPAKLYDKTVPLFRRMLVALSGQETDEELLQYAGLLGQVLPGLDVVGVHVVDAQAQYGLKGLGDELRRRFRHHLPTGSAEVVAGNLLDRILEVTVARGCDLILLGHRHGARRRRSLARRLAMKAPCSVWMVPVGSPPVISRLLVPIDFSPRSADSLRLATGITEAVGRDECLALHVYFNHAAATFDEFDEILVESAEQTFGIFIAPIDMHGIYARPVFIESPNVAPTILRVAAEQQSDLIVMGTRGRSRSAAVLLGSETEHVLMDSAIPVLTVKHFGARLRLLQALRDERVRKRASEEWYI